jgi:hypothetical protein
VILASCLKPRRHVTGTPVSEAGFADRFNVAEGLRKANHTLVHFGFSSKYHDFGRGKLSGNLIAYRAFIKLRPDIRIKPPAIRDKVDDRRRRRAVCRSFARWGKRFE